MKSGWLKYDRVHKAPRRARVANVYRVHPEDTALQQAIGRAARALQAIGVQLQHKPKTPIKIIHDYTRMAKLLERLLIKGQATEAVAVQNALYAVRDVIQKAKKAPPRKRLY